MRSIKLQIATEKKCLQIEHHQEVEKLCADDSYCEQNGLYQDYTNVDTNSSARIIKVKCSV